MKQRVAVIVPTHNRLEKLKLLISDLFKQRSQFIYDVFITDAGSTDGTREFILSCEHDIQLITGNSDWWYTKSINEGLKKADNTMSYQCFILINDDCRIEEDFISKMLDAYLSLPKKSILGPVSVSVEHPQKYLFIGIKKIIWWRYKVLYYQLSDLRPDNKNELEGIYRSYSLPGRGMLIPKIVLNEIGFLDENFPQYYSDSEIVFRANNAGIKSYINTNTKLATYITTAGKGSSYSGQTLVEFTKNFFNPYSKNNLKNIWLIINKYGIKSLAPLTFTIKLLGQYKNYLLKKEVI